MDALRTHTDTHRGVTTCSHTITTRALIGNMVYCNAHVLACLCYACVPLQLRTSQIESEDGNTRNKVSAAALKSAKAANTIFLLATQGSNTASNPTKPKIGRPSKQNKPKQPAKQKAIKAKKGCHGGQIGRPRKKKPESDSVTQQRKPQKRVYTKKVNKKIYGFTRLRVSAFRVSVLVDAESGAIVVVDV